MTLPPHEMMTDASAADAPATAPSELPRRVKILPVLFVLIFGTYLPLRPLQYWIFPALSRFGWSQPSITGVATIFVQATITVTVLLVVHFWERLPMRSIGIVRFAATDLALGVAAFVGIGVIEGLALPLVLLVLTGSHDWGIASSDAHQFKLISQWPWPLMLATAVSAGVYEEIWSRGYAVERLEALTHSTIAAAAVALTLDVGAHVPFWGIRYAILIAPCQVVLLGLYLWRRRLWPCVVAHVLWDAACPIAFALTWLLATTHAIHATWRL
ncbi:MAG TPA: CPBP family intramembrane glutamic endopeptidase [Candidatus Binataceae bacterium]|nr:CPBP family intramembrane glutamic endopeptidase [Candidatus Binataceae bacterium]